MLLRLILIFLSFSCCGVYGQDTTAVLPEVGVLGDRLQKFGVGTKVLLLDSAVLKNYANTSLAEILAQQSGAFIKNYGPGNLASISFRGTNASQTAVLWNGFNLQSAMLGQVDFSLLPVNMADEIKIQHGGASALYGSGAMGGAVHINNKSSYNSGFCAALGSSVGSFQNLQQTLSLKYGTRRWSAALHLFYKDAVNNFPYKPSNGAMLRQAHAQVKQKGWLFENYLKLTAKQEVNLMVWYMAADRQLPASTESGKSIATQQDESWRVSSQWKREGRKLTLATRAALLTEKLNYRNYESSFTEALTTVLESEATFKISEFHSFHLGVNNTWQHVVSTNFSQPNSLNRASVFANYRVQNRRRTLLGSVGVRKEFTTSFSPAPITPFVGAEFKVLKRLSLLLSGSRNYRVPTLNDLYWQDGAAVGNRTLLPENAWMADAGAKLNLPLTNTGRSGTANLDFSSNYFYGYIFNYIQWQPNGSGQWSPENVNEVATRGVESVTSFSYRKNGFGIRISVATNYVLSTNEKAKSAQDNAYRRQLIYVPIYNHQGNLTLSWKDWQVNYNQTYTGYRFTTADNKKALPPFTLGNLRVSRDLDIKSFSLNLFLQANNLWDTQYQVVQHFAVPGFNWQLGFKMNFHKHNSLKIN